MGKATKHVSNEQVNEIAAQLARWSKKAKQEYPQHLEDALRLAAQKLDPQALAEASAGIVAAVSGNQKAAKQVQKLVAGAGTSAQQPRAAKPVKTSMPSAPSNHSKGRGVLYGLGAVAAILAACLGAMWRATRTVERSPQPAQSVAAPTLAATLTESPGIDPDMTRVPAR